jgi:hypothetical protein
MTDSSNTIIAPPRPEDRTYQWRLVYTGNIRRCVRGIPIVPVLPLPTNDNLTGGRYPLQEEFRAKRMAKTDEEAEILWSTSRWFKSHYEMQIGPTKPALTESAN